MDKVFVAYDWQGNEIGFFSTEHEAWRFLDSCDLSGTVKEYI